MDNPRKLALSSLIRSEQSSSYSNLEINTVISRADMSRVDIALYTALYLGVTERLITLDYLISKYSDKPLSELDIEVKNALRLGFYQIMYMDKIPEYSAVSETVSLCPKRSRGFVNACLRSFIRSDKELVLPEDEWQAISIKSSIPEGILNIFRASYGDETAKKLALSIKARKGVTIRINPLKIEPSQMRKKLKQRGITYTPVGFSDESLTVNAPISELVEYIDKGYFFIQDTASFACAKIFGAQANEKILDTCACPGGKSFSSAIEMKNEGSVISCDLHKNKLSLVSNGAQKLGIDIIEAVEQDAKKPREEFIDSFDRVLCDVPCSGLGVIAKKPDIKYKSLEQIEALPEIQTQILENCSKYVKLGGYVVYSTCTLNSAENESVVNAFLKSNSAFEAVDFELGDEIRSQNGMFTFMPHLFETDGFFIAKMKRVK